MITEGNKLEGQGSIDQLADRSTAIILPMRMDLAEEGHHGGPPIGAKEQQ